MAAAAIDLGYAVLKDGGVMSWDGTRTPRRVPGIDDAIRVSGGMVVRRNGTLALLEDRGHSFRRLRGVIDASSNDDLSCAVMKRGQVRGAPSRKSILPMAVAGSRDARKVAVGGWSTRQWNNQKPTACALTQSGQVWCWKHDAPGAAARAQRIEGIDGATGLQVAAAIGCAHWEDGSSLTGMPTIFAVTDSWSDGDPYAVLCRAISERVRCDHVGLQGPELKSAIKLEVASTTRVVALAADPDIMCALDEHGHMRCVGSNRRGFLGHLQAGVVDRPMRIDGIPPLTSIIAGDAWACGITAASAMWCVPGDGEPVHIDLGSPVIHLMGSKGHLCALNAKREATCFDADSKGLRNATRVPALDGARAATFPGGNVHSDVVSVITEQRQLAVGLLPDSSISDLALTVVPGVSKVIHVARSIYFMETDSFWLSIQAENDAWYTVDVILNPMDTGTRRNSGLVLGGLYEVKPPRRMPRSQTIIAMNVYGRALHSDGSLDTGKHRRKTMLTTLLDGSIDPCGITANRDLVCVDVNPPPSLVDHPDDRVIMRNVRAAASGPYGDPLFMLDSEGRLHCHGRCGGDGGIDATDTLLLVPLREQPRVVGGER